MHVMMWEFRIILNSTIVIVNTYHILLQSYLCALVASMHIQVAIAIFYTLICKSIYIYLSVYLWCLTSFSPWCLQVTRHLQKVHLNLNGTDALWMQGHLLLHSQLNLVAYFAAPSSFRVLVGGSTISTSLQSQTYSV